ncbi:hypothetical protein [Achromobacter marplatensis]|uniref:Uncharacterized protein n=1 Tax=Achromobacter marplatensis TaxID=470868 RepID=A0ABX9GID7_9BURK|nr:hypothetical protein [Achromobacter marplatensis]RBP22615.1 hypothetical protein DFP87_102357 [Achromobacter marplatensis]CAB3648634.1 hypothetical protein LMG26219_02635 [Achromobacter marplatensis]
MLITVLFVKQNDHYLVGDPDNLQPWVPANPEALAALHTLVTVPGWRIEVANSGGVSKARSAEYQRLVNTARAIQAACPSLARELLRGLGSKRQGDGRLLWRYDKAGALVRIETALAGRMEEIISAIDQRVA